MKTRTTITIETVRQIRVLHASPLAARSCPFCGAETVLSDARREAIACEIVENDPNTNALAVTPIKLINRSNNNE